MAIENYRESDLEKWLKERQMTTNDFVQLIGCSRPVVWKVKRGIPICPLYARKIYEFTGGKIRPLIKNVGRQL